MTPEETQALEDILSSEPGWEGMFEGIGGLLTNLTPADATQMLTTLDGLLKTRLSVRQFEFDERRYEDEKKQAHAFAESLSPMLANMGWSDQERKEFLDLAMQMDADQILTVFQLIRQEYAASLPFQAPTPIRAAMTPVLN